MRQALLLAAVAALLSAGAATAAPVGHGHHRKAMEKRSARMSNGYLVHNLVSDQPGRADHTDPNLVNAWGLTSLSGSPWWVADNGTDKTTVYDAAGNPFPSASPIVVNVPSAPTGAVANSGSGFVVSNGSASGAATFLFATEEGKILGWNRNVSATQAVVAVDDTAQHAVFKGLALSPDGRFLYATDFHNGRVDVFDTAFHVTTSGGFVDPRIPSGYAPFGIQSVNGQILVTYAKQDAQRHDDVAGQGNGFVDAFDTSGKLLARVGTHGQLNSPWGLALAPQSFGRFSGDLLVGNFGDGRINAFAMRSDGRFEPAGALRMGNGQRIVIDGLWSLQFGQGATLNGPTNTLFFTAGPNGEQHGLFGTIQAH